MGFVQGLTEFLPISSSGHLVLASNVLHIQGNTGILFEVMLHLGTLVSVFIVFYKDIYNMIIEFFKMARDIIRKRDIGLRDNPYRVMIVMVVIGTIPTGLIGILFKDILESAFGSTLLVSLMLLITGTFLYIANGLGMGAKSARGIRIRDALFVGTCQGLAITPGISRSGATIFAGLTRGFNRELATKFSFILSIPAILGAAAIQFFDYSGAPISPRYFLIMSAGTAVAAVMGTVSIKFLIGVLNRGKLHYFSYYCWSVGFIGIIIGLIPS